MPNYDLGLLITLDIALALLGLFGTLIGFWMIIRQNAYTMREITEGMRDISTMQREVAFMIRRQYADIDRDLQEIKGLLGGQ